VAGIVVGVVAGRAVAAGGVAALAVGAAVAAGGALAVAAGATVAGTAVAPLVGAPPQPASAASSP
jgi:hypothetical protein